MEVPLDLPGLSGYIVSRPYQGESEGGDVHFVSSCGTGRITRILLADVSGHGEAAGQLGRRLRDLMFRYLNHVRPNALAKRLNREVIGLVGQSGRFATGLIVTFFSPHGHMSICNAGHPPPLLYRAATNQWEAVRNTSLRGVSNLPLGIVENSGYVGHRLTLEPGDLLLGYSDCLIEATDVDGEMLQVEGLLKMAGLLTPEQMAEPQLAVTGLMQTLEDAGCQLDDDMTVFALRCTERSRGRGLRAFARGTLRAIRRVGQPRLLPLPDLPTRWRV